MSRRTAVARPPIRKRTAALRRAITEMDLVASGSLQVRTKVCGRKNCRCALDPEARHGPYHEWTRRENGRLVHSVITPAQAQLLARAIENYREIQKLLGAWHRETAEAILELNRKKT